MLGICEYSDDIDKTLDYAPDPLPSEKMGGPTEDLDEPETLGKLMKLEFGQGLIPERFAEVHRIVPLDSSAGQEFQKEMFKLAKVLDPERNFDEKPIRFFLMQDEKIPAMAIRIANPPLIGLSTELFDPNSKIALQSLDELLGIMCHEGAHIIFREEFAERPNEKFEEGSADVIAVHRLYERGFDPRAALTALKRIFDIKGPVGDDEFGQKHPVRKFLREVLDVHPTDETRINYLEAALTRLERKEGKFQVLPTPLDAGNVYEIFGTNAKHTSFVDRFCAEIKFFELSLHEKLVALETLLESHPQADLNDSRATDLVKLISRLEFQPDGLSGKEISALKSLSDVILDRIYELPEHSELYLREDDYYRTSVKARHFIDPYRTYWVDLYQDLAKTLAPEKNPLEISRLGSLFELSRNLIGASNREEIQSNGIELYEAFKNEKLCDFWYNREFLHDFSWPTFDLPTKIGEKVPWNQLVEVALELSAEGDQRVLEALLSIGIEDERLLKAVSDEWVLKLLVDSSIETYHYYNLRAGFCKGSIRKSPEKTENGKDYEGVHTIHHFVLDSEGFVKEIIPPGYPHGSPGDPSTKRLWAPLARESLVLSPVISLDKDPRNRVESFDHRMFRMFADAFAEDPKLKLNSTLKSDDSSSRDKTSDSLTSARRLWNDFGNSSGLIGLSKLTENPKEVAELNSSLLRDKDEIQEFLIQEIVKLLDGPEGGKEEIRTAVATLVRELGGCYTKGASIASIDEDEPFGVRPIGEFLLSDNYNLFTKREKFEALIPSACHISFRKNYKELNKYLDKILPPHLSQYPSSWGEVLELLKGANKYFKEINVFNGKGTMLSQWYSILSSFCEARTLNPDKFPTPTCSEITLYLKFCLFPHCCYYDGTKSIGDVFTEALNENPLWSSKLSARVTEWCELGFSVYSSECKRRDLKELIVLIDKETLSPTIRLDFFNKLLHKSSSCGPRLREELRERWLEASTQIFGNDDETPGYSERLIAHLKNAKEFLGTNDAIECFKALAERIEAQAKLTETISKNVPSPDEDRTFNGIGWGTLGLDSALHGIRRKPHIRIATKEFLMRPLTNESIEMFVEEIKSEKMQVLGSEKQSTTSKDKDNSDVRYGAKLLYESFWDKSFEMRAALGRELILPIGISKEEEKGAFSYVVDKISSTDETLSPRFRRFVEVYLDIIPSYQKPVLLSALLVAAEPDPERKSGIGRALALIGSALGPGENKGVQAAHSHPSTSEDLREELKVSKILADKPNRNELFKWIDECVPEEARNEISHYGKILGSGSFFVTLEVHMNDGTRQALQIERPNVKERCETGLEYIRETVKLLSKEDPSFEILQEFCNEAEVAWKEELDTTLGLEKLLKAREIYHNLEIDVDGHVVTMNVPDIYSLSSGKVAFGDRYRILNIVDGTHFLSLEAEEKVDEAKLFAKAMLFVELSQLLAGEVWDDDCHGGNIKVLEDSKSIGRFDFGGLSIDPPATEELMLLSDALGACIKESKGGGDFSLRYFTHIKKLRDEGKEISRILRRTQKTLLTLSEYSRILSDDDIRKVVFSAYASAHPIVKGALSGAFGFGALKRVTANFLGHLAPVKARRKNT